MSAQVEEMTAQAQELADDRRAAQAAGGALQARRPGRVGSRRGRRIAAAARRLEPLHY